MTDPRRPQTFVLVPGAWLGGWSWYPVARLLRQSGHQVVALTLPGLSYGSSPVGLRMIDATDLIVAEVERRDLHDVVLVSHSWGGYPATAAAHRLAGRVSRVIYYNAVVPERRKAMVDENDQFAHQIQDLMATTSDGTVPIPFAALQLGMMHDESPELQELVFAMMVPTPAAYMLDAVDVADVTTIGLPAAYVLGVDDISLARPGAEFAARISVEPVMVPGSHMGMLSKPASVATALTGLL